MKYNKTLALVPAILLAACGGDEQTMNEPQTPGSVVYSYPADGQSAISPTTDIVIRFSHVITDEETDLQNKISLSNATDPVSFTVTKVDGGRSLKLTPDDNLSLGDNYSISFTDPLVAEGAREITTPNAVGADGIQFAVRGGFTGIAGLDNLSGNFSVARLIPSPDDPFQPMDFSTFRLGLTQPVHPDWKAMGSQITLENSAGEPVPATILVNGRNISIDPCTVEAKELCGTKEDTLAPGESYTLRIQGLPSLTSPDTTLDFSREFTPRETSPTVVLYQEVIDSGLLAGSDAEDARKSRLNGQVINGVTLNSVLQGIAGPSQQTGSLFAELAYAPSFAADEPLPLRIPKGSVLTSSSLDVRINGSVPVIDPTTDQLQTTGDIKVTMLSDATGYLSPNPYTDDLSAPRHVKLYMDVSMNTGEAQPNAALSQDLLGVELSGIAIVENGVLTIDAIGVVEPELLGQEYTNSTIAFRIEAATDADSALDAEGLWTPDTTSPQLVSWMPGPQDAIPATRQSMQRPGDPVILNFNEPLAPESLATGLTMFEDGVEIASLKSKLDGTSVVLNPAGGLKHGKNYRVQIDGVTDIAGNLATSADLNFALDTTDTETPSVPQRSPLAVTTYPGYPCETTQSQVDLIAGIHGRCWDVAPGGEAGDELPVTNLPSDRPITIVFSQSMDLDSIRLGETFIIEKVNSDKTLVEAVPGRLEKNNQRIRFFPDSPWETGSFYRYTMVSAPGAICSGANKPVICGENGLALQTDLLEDSEDVGGQSMTIYFEGSEALSTVFTPLRNLPVRDANANYVVDCSSLGDESCLEPFSHDGNDNDGFLPSANASKLVVAPEGPTFASAARVGCRTDGSDCPRNKFIYQTYALNTEVTGPAVDPDTGKTGVGVLLYPTLLATTSADVYLQIPLLGQQKSVTKPQILRMRYAKDDPNCTSNCSRSSLIPGIIIEDDNGTPVFKTKADLFLDAPNLEAPLGASHNLYSYPFTLDLEGPVRFFDDGRMQVEQRNINLPAINVKAVALGVFTINIPLIIPQQGVYLNFISNPVKEIPAEQ